MVLFGFIFFVSVVALLAVRAMNIECEAPPRASAVMVYSDRNPGFPADSMRLRRI
jgi:hypothetical protein